MISAIVLFAVRLLSQQPAEKTPQPGQQLFASSCAGCHGLDARGGEHAPNIATTSRLQQMSDPDLIRTVRRGIPSAGMPAFSSLLTSDQTRAVVSYLRVLQGKRQAVEVQGNPEVGQALFFGNAKCSGCHMVAGRGGFLGADLSSYASTHSAAEIRKAIVSPDADPESKGSAVSVVTRAGQTYTGLARNEDNFSLQLETSDGVFHLLDKTNIVSLRHEPRSIMPSDYGSTLSKGELDDLISYLVHASSSANGSPVR